MGHVREPSQKKSAILTDVEYMKIKLLSAIAAALLLFLSSLTFTADEEPVLKTSSEKLSYALGLEIGANLKALPTAINLPIFLRNFRGQLHGKEATPYGRTSGRSQRGTHPADARTRRKEPEDGSSISFRERKEEGRSYHCKRPPIHSASRRRRSEAQDKRSGPCSLSRNIDRRDGILTVPTSGVSPPPSPSVV